MQTQTQTHTDPHTPAHECIILATRTQTKFNSQHTHANIHTAFLAQVTVSWQHMSSVYHVPLHSKIASRRWPIVDAICGELLALLPTQYHDGRPACCRAGVHA